MRGALAAVFRRESVVWLSVPARLPGSACGARSPQVTAGAAGRLPGRVFGSWGAARWHSGRGVPAPLGDPFRSLATGSGASGRVFRGGQRTPGAGARCPYQAHPRCLRDIKPAGRLGASGGASGNAVPPDGVIDTHLHVSIEPVLLIPSRGDCRNQRIELTARGSCRNGGQPSGVWPPAVEYSIELVVGGGVGLELPGQHRPLFRKSRL